MNFSEEWKSIFPIGSVFQAPLLLSSKEILGPLVFNPDEKTLTLLFKSPSLFPPLLNPPPQLSLSRFLSTTTTANSPLPYSTASNIASLFGSRVETDSASLLTNNHLQFLRYPNKNAVIVFFPTGSNHHQIGFLLIHVKDKSLHTVGDSKGGILVANKCSECFHQRIVRILVNSAESCGYFEGNDSSPHSIGYLLVYTMYSVHWYCVKIGETSEKPVLCYAGWKAFKSCCIVDACWSPHLAEECVVLLENGDLFLFDMNLGSSKGSFRGTRLKVPIDSSGTSGKRKWLGCVISWHPRIFIVASSDAVFLVDYRFDDCKVNCLANIDMFGVYSPAGNEQFLALSKVVSDQFHFLLASEKMLVLCDVRRPLMPVLQWAHGVQNPCYINVFRLSDLRSNSSSNEYNWATASGFGIILGSFWDSEFSLFYYGPPLPSKKGSLASEISKISNSSYAWELPSGILLCGNKCQCGSCLVNQEFLKQSFPEWIHWQQKEDIVVGFEILSHDLSSLLFEPDEFGGFTLIRLMSSGKLVAQRYYASWTSVRKLESSHRKESVSFKENLLVNYEDEKYRFVRKFKYINLDYLSAYLKGNLSQILDSNSTKRSKYPLQNESFSTDFHEILCEKLKICGLGKFRTSPAIRVVFDNINLPTSIHEVALRSIWASMPIELLQLAFSSYTEMVKALDQKTVDLEFLAVPELPQLPPFFLRKPSNRGNKWTSKVPRSSDDLVGPVLPLPVLTTLHELQNGCPNSQHEKDGFSPEKELGIRCSEVMEVARETTVLDSSVDFDTEEVISLSGGRDDIWDDSEKKKSLVLYCPGTDRPTRDSGERNSGYKDNNFSLFISKLHEKEPDIDTKEIVDATLNKKKSVGLELFDDVCPIQLKFDAPEMEFGMQELRSYNMLKRHVLKWQNKFKPYHRFCSQFQKQGI